MYILVYRIQCISLNIVGRTHFYRILLELLHDQIVVKAWALDRVKNALPAAMNDSGHVLD